MKFPTLIKPSLLKKLVLILVGLSLATLLFLWLALPRIVQSQAEKFVAEKTGHRLMLDRPEFNPFRLALRLGKLQLTEPDGKPLLSFDALLVDISAASITQRALVFDAIRLDGPAATVVELPGGALNWTPFLAALKSSEEQPEEKKGLPRLDIRSFELINGKLDFADRRADSGFVTRVAPLDLELTDLSTLPDDAGKFKIAARTLLGARVDLVGQIDLNPMMVVGTFSLADLQLAQFAPYLKTALPVPPEGVAGVTASYRVGNAGGKIDATVEQIEAQLTGLRVTLKDAGGPVATIDNIELKDGRFQLAKQELVIGAIAVNGGKLALPQIDNPPQFAALTIGDIRVALAERNATAGSLKLADGRIQAVREADGSIDLQEALMVLSAGKPAAEKPVAETVEPVAPWRFKIDKIEVANLGVALRDASVAPAAELALDNIAAQVEGLGSDMSAPLPLRLSFDARSGGHFAAEGKVMPAAPAAEINFKLTDLALKLAQPYLAAKTTLTLADGKLSTQGRALYDAKAPHAINVRGEFSVRDLRLIEPGADEPLLAWKTFGSRDLTLTQKVLNLGELRLNGLDTRLIIDKDKNFNFKKVMMSSGAGKAVPATAPDEKASVGVPAAGHSIPPAPSFIVNIDRLRFNKGEMDFADQSLIIPFATRIHNLRGSIAGLSNRPGAVGQVELDGAVDEFGLARAVGQVDLSNPKDSLDMRVQFRNVEMTRLTPYMATFAGRKIDSGKLSLDLHYQIKQRQLQGENQIIMDQLTLGERVDSPTAQDLPLDLAIAILQDSAGRIDLGLPVAGSLDDPSFSYGAIIWKAITNVLTKIATAPFRALGGLFGGSGEKTENIVFDAGAPQLTPPEREKVVRLAEALGKRPGLLLAVGGIHADADRVALQEVQLRRTVLAQSGQRVSEKGDPGPLSTQQPKIREALEALYKERFGASELAALKEGFRGANPGQLEESMTGKVLSRMTGLLREKKTPSESEVAQLKGADFYSVLFEHLRAKEVVADTRLQALAQSRGEGVVEILKSAGAATERVQLLAPEKGDSSNGEIPLRMSLEPAKTSK